MRCNFCGAEWTLPYKATFEDCPFCLRPLGKASQNHHTSGNPLSDFDIVGTVLRAYKGTNPVVVVPSFITELGYVSIHGTFHENTVIEKVVLPDTMSEIPARTFYRCTSLREIFFPKALKRIGQDAFYGCTALTKIVIPEGVEEIGSCAFSGCIYLEEVVIPESLKRFDSGYDSEYPPFRDCKRIRHIECPGPMLGIFANSSKFADEFRQQYKQRRERENRERAAKIDAGICPYCGGKLGFFSSKCKSCGRG